MITHISVASAPTNVRAVQEGLTSVRVSWSPPTPLGDTTGYRIYYSGNNSGHVNVTDGSTDNVLLPGLQNGSIYTISIVATSLHFSSTAINQEVILCEYRHTVFSLNLISTVMERNTWFPCSFLLSF